VVHFNNQPSAAALNVCLDRTMMSQGDHCKYHTRRHEEDPLVQDGMQLKRQHAVSCQYQALVWRDQMPVSPGHEMPNSPKVTYGFLLEFVQRTHNPYEQ
jgi:hypothetical protein